MSRAVEINTLHVKLLSTLLRYAVLLLIARVTVGIVLGYRSCLPPDFSSEFLSGRQAYFFGPYKIAFWVHIFTTPLAMLAGTLLLSRRLRRARPSWHRMLGRVQVSLVVLLVVPSSLWMSLYAQTGWIAGLAFFIGASAMGYCTLRGWRAALHRQFQQHERWMMRSYLLLCSAIVLRILSGAATLLQWDALWSYPLFAWLSMTVPLLAYELYFYVSRHRVPNC